MFKDPDLLEALLDTTKDMIEDNCWTLTFKRKTFARTGSGGQVAGPPTDVDPQNVYLGAVTIDASYTVFWEGNKVQADYVIIGLPDLDIEEKDEFTADGRKFVVVEIHPDHEYETRAWCVDRTSSGR